MLDKLPLHEGLGNFDIEFDSEMSFGLVFRNGTHVLVLERLFILRGFGLAFTNAMVAFEFVAAWAASYAKALSTMVSKST